MTGIILARIMIRQSCAGTVILPSAMNPSKTTMIKDFIECGPIGCCLVLPRFAQAQIICGKFFYRNLAQKILAVLFGKPVSEFNQGFKIDVRA